MILSSEHNVMRPLDPPRRRTKTNALATNGFLLWEVALFHGVLSTLTPLHLMCVKHLWWPSKRLPLRPYTCKHFFYNLEKPSQQARWYTLIVKLHMTVSSQRISQRHWSTSPYLVSGYVSNLLRVSYIRNTCVRTNNLLTSWPSHSQQQRSPYNITFFD